jgi:restriction system protein
MSQISVGPMESIRGPRSTKCRQQVSHSGLHKHRVITSPYESDVAQKVRMQIAVWVELWDARTEEDAARQARQDAKEAVEFRKEEAADRTAEAKAALEELDAVLENRNALP